MIDNYNEQLRKYNSLKRDVDIEGFIDNDPKKIKWSSSLKDDFKRKISLKFNKSKIVEVMYRPFCKQWLYFDSNLNHRVYQMPKIFKDGKAKNFIICATGRGATARFSSLISQIPTDLEMISKAQCFPFFLYSENDNSNLSLNFDNADQSEGITKQALEKFITNYSDKTITKDQVYYYIYGILHSEEFKNRFESNLGKTMTRIPFAQDFWAFSKAGRELAKWHLNYETVTPYKLKQSADEFDLDPKEFYKVQKMRFGKNGKEEDKTSIIYNSKIILSGIPLEAYEYVVNGRPALEWIIDRYQVTVDQDSGIKNDPNDWSDDPKYIVNLVKRIVTVSLETMKIVKSLPPLNERK